MNKAKKLKYIGAFAEAGLSVIIFGTGVSASTINDSISIYSARSENNKSQDSEDEKETILFATLTNQKNIVKYVTGIFNKILILCLYVPGKFVTKRRFMKK